MTVGAGTEMVPGTVPVATSTLVLNVLNNRTTRDRAIRAKDLAKLVGDTERGVRRTIRALRILGYPIASVTEEPGGYFMATKPEDLNETLRHLAARRRKIEEPMEALSKAQRRLARQCRLAKQRGA